MCISPQPHHDVLLRRIDTFLYRNLIIVRVDDRKADAQRVREPDTAGIGIAVRRHVLVDLIDAEVRDQSWLHRQHLGLASRVGSEIGVRIQRVEKRIADIERPGLLLGDGQVGLWSCLDSAELQRDFAAAVVPYIDDFEIAFGWHGTIGRNVDVIALHGRRGELASTDVEDRILIRQE